MHEETPRRLVTSPGLLLLAYVGFVSLGLPDTLLGVAWPSIRGHFGLDHSASAWLFFGAGASYFTSSFFSGRLLKLLNVGWLLALSSGVVALSAFNYSAAGHWFWFAAGSLLHGAGSGAIDAGLNHYAAHHFSARHMNWLHASYSLGAMLGPLLMTIVIARLQSWRAGYFLVACTLLTMAALFFATRSRWSDNGAPGKPGDLPHGEEPPSAGAVLRNPLVWLQMLVFFVYTGVEAAIGQWTFTALSESRGVSLRTAGAWVTVYWGSILAGRIFFGFIADRFQIDSLVRFSTFLALLSTALLAWDPHPVSAPIALAVCGFGLAPIYPSLMSRTPSRFGAAIAVHAIGFQVGAAMLGAACLPSFTGLVAGALGVGTILPLFVMFALMLVIGHELLRGCSGTRATVGNCP